MDDRTYQGGTAKLTFRKSEDETGATLVTEISTIEATANGELWEVVLDAGFTESVETGPIFPFKSVSWQFLVHLDDGTEQITSDGVLKIWRKLSNPRPKSIAEQRLEKLQATLQEMDQDGFAQTSLDGVSITRARRPDLEREVLQLNRTVMYEEAVRVLARQQQGKTR